MPTKKKPVSDKLTLDDLAALLGVGTYDDLHERNWEWLADSAAYAGDQDSEEYQQAYDELDRKLFEAWCDALFETLDPLFEEHGLKLESANKRDRYAWEHRVVPKVSWDAAARAIVETINGVGYFHFSSVREFLSSGPYTARTAVLGHLHYVPQWVEVYEGGKANRRFEKNLEHTMRYL